MKCFSLKAFYNSIGGYKNSDSKLELYAVYYYVFCLVRVLTPTKTERIFIASQSNSEYIAQAESGVFLE